VRQLRRGAACVADESGQDLVQVLQQQHAATEDALQAKRAELLAVSQQVNIMKGQAEAARMQISDMSRHDANVMEQCPPPPPHSHPLSTSLPTRGLIFSFRYTALLVNFDRNVQMYQEMYAQHRPFSVLL
jgi:hypothetical protein